MSDLRDVLYFQNGAEMLRHPAEWGMRRLLHPEEIADMEVVIAFDESFSTHGQACYLMDDDEDYPTSFVVTINPVLCIVDDSLLRTLFHELDHVAAYFRLEMYDHVSGDTIWRGRSYRHGPDLSYKEYLGLPWEVSARRTEVRLYHEYTNLHGRFCDRRCS